ncbi:hypothetical protein B0H10DRAFT_2239096 [Mycena sp. CBHHK59/15]|nr:hypothetical protein B0H10DRAFT_2239096 [Mycena sp. CBHHK59/15]
MLYPIVASIALGLFSAVSALPVGRDAGPVLISRAVTTAKDGSKILDSSVVIGGLNMRFKISGPPEAFIGAAGAATGAATTMGINVLFHGDGGQSFFDFPNQGVQNTLMGVALLAPNKEMRWGGLGNGLDRPDGALHSAAVNAFITKVLPQMMNFDNTKVFMEGISGGSLLLSGFLLPAFGASLKSQLQLSDVVAVAGDISNMRIHWQSSTDDLAILQQSIPLSIQAYEKLASDAGKSATEINQLQTADASPNGGHCEFDEQDFVSGVQLLTDNYASILTGSGKLNGVSVETGVVGNEQLF